VYLSGAILGMRRREIAAKFDQIVAFAGVAPFIDMRSSGTRRGCT
jgi:lipopolysaccharide transport system ATP-binding protein